MGFISIRAPRLDDLQRKLALLPPKARGVVADGIEEATYVVESATKDNLSGNAERGDPVQLRSGRTKASVASYTDKQQLRGITGTPVEWARMLEWGTEGLPGGKLTPRLAKVLAVPLPAALTDSGKSRGGPRDLGQKYDAAFWMKKPGWKDPIFFGKKGDRLVALFVGKKEVTIEGRAPFGQAAETSNDKVVQLLDQAVQKVLPGN